MIECPWQSRFLSPAVELFLAELEDTGISVAAFEEARAAAPTARSGESS